MAKKEIPGLPDPLGIVERLTEKGPLPFKLVDPLKHLIGFELIEAITSLPPGAPVSLKWKRRDRGS